VKFIFATTEIRRVPVTVLSRCQRFNLRRFSHGELAAFLADVCRKEGASLSADALSLIARAAEGSARDALSILDQAILASPGGAGSSDAAVIREMLGVADPRRLEDLLERILRADRRGALSDTEELIASGADGPALIRDLMELVVECARAEALGEAYRNPEAADGGARVRELSSRQSAAQNARIWRVLVQGYEDCLRAPDPQAAAGMVVLRLVAVMSLPPPEDAVKLLGAEHDGAGAREDLHHPRADPGDSGPAPPGPVLSTLAGVMAELQARREIDLIYDIEQYVRPAEIAYGVFRFATVPGAPPDLTQRLRAALEASTGVVWTVAGGSQASAETPAERRARILNERREAAGAHPRVRALMEAFPGAEILSVEDPRSAEDEAYADDAEGPSERRDGPGEDPSVPAFEASPEYLQAVEEDFD